VRLFDKQEQILVAIDDEGPGVPKELAGNLFQKFAQGKGRSGKIGLGLYFCRMTVERWGGSIGHEPGASGGSRFWFQLTRPKKDSDRRFCSTSLPFCPIISLQSLLLSAC
jgi:K+-sensing histidine kinase KdpD